MKKLPRIYRGKFEANSTIVVDPKILIRFMGGFFITSGSFKGIIDVSKGNQEKFDEIFFPTNTLILDEGYKTESEGPLIEWTQNQFPSMTKNGWKLVSLEQSKTLCFNYSLDLKVEEKNNISQEMEIVSARRGSIEKIRYQDYPQAYDYYKIKEERIIFVPENHLLVLAKGTALINYQEKKPKTWIRSTKDQGIRISSKDENDEVLIFLLKTTKSKV